MTLTVIDSIVLVALLLGALIGFKQGVVKSAVSFIGLIIVIILAWNLKNPVSEFLYLHLPFFNLGTQTALFNIIIYELIAFLLIAILLSVVLRLILVFTGLVEKILNFTIVLGFVSKILGMIFGFVEFYVIIFFILFGFYSLTSLSQTIKDDNITNTILTKTPILSSTVENDVNVIKEIVDLKEQYNSNSDEYNAKVFDIMLKYKLLKKDNAIELINKNKININGSEEILSKY